MAPLVMALRPTETGVAVLRIRMRPCIGWMLTSGWRAEGLRMLLHMQQRDVHTLNGDRARLEGHLDASAFAVTMLVLVGYPDRSAQSRAAAATQHVGLALAPFAQRIGAWRREIQMGRAGVAVLRPQRRKGNGNPRDWRYAICVQCCISPQGWNVSIFSRHVRHERSGTACEPCGFFPERDA